MYKENVINSHLKTMKFRRRHKYLPCITPEIRRLITRRAYLHKKALCSNDDYEWLNYKRCRNKVTSMIRKRRGDDITSACSRAKGNPGKVWKSLNNAMGRNTKDRDTLSVTINDSTLSYLTSTSNNLNHHFIMNRQNYVDYYVKYILTDSVAKQFEAFSRGFHLVCGGPALKLFQAEETELLVCGNPELDFKALEACTTYEDGFTRYHRTIKAFWSVVHSLNQNQKKKLLNFITGSDRVPVKGLSSLPIVIQRHGPDSDRLPTAMTCFNRLLLPSYSSKEKLRNRITIALENGKGFGLT
ncbi:ubiquitin-protein ligase E3A-like [Anneissia japonica]|uniref:ubiquitin-protein ligase E3A-like n=1 Tax=Anneissia japonica TaxID=1529436 RepID=UPI00142571FF|nr:ubiquitin-protein ligase E3A-like [Anneissia japonica]